MTDDCCAAKDCCEAECCSGCSCDKLDKLSDNIRALTIQVRAMRDSLDAS